MTKDQANGSHKPMNGPPPGGPPPGGRPPGGPPGNENAPDGGWGWMVVLGTSIATLLQGVMVQGFGVLFLEFVHRYQVSAQATSWVGAINMASVGLFSPIASVLCNRFTCQKVGTVGGVLVSIGLVCTAFAPNIIVVYITFGLIPGLGICLLTTSGYILLGQYFNRRKAFAMALTALGTGLGLVVFPPVIVKLFEKYGYVGTMLILGGVSLHAILAGLLLRPLPPPTQKEKPQELENRGKIYVKADGEDPDDNDKLMDEEKGREAAPTNGAPAQRGPGGPPGGPPGGKPKLFDFALLTNPVFDCLCFIYFNVALCLGLGTAFLPPLAMERGVPTTRAAFLLSTGGIAGVVGVLGLGIVMDFDKVRPHRVTIFNTCAFLLGVSNLLTPPCPEYISLSVAAAIRGITSATLMTQRATASADLVGGPRVPSAFGLLSLAFALGSLIGRPIGGILKDQLNYESSFYLSGASGIFGSVLFTVVRYVWQARRRRSENITY